MSRMMGLNCYIEAINEIQAASGPPDPRFPPAWVCYRLPASIARGLLLRPRNNLQPTIAGHLVGIPSLPLSRE